MMESHHHGGTYIRETGDGPRSMMAAMIAVLVLALVGFLIWLFAFSGVVHRGGDSGTTTKIEQSVGNNGGGGGGGTVPSPASS
jgi:hypothetical protein